MRKFIKRIKACASILRHPRCWYATFDGDSMTDEQIFKCVAMLAASQLQLKENESVNMPRLQMIESVLNDPSVIVTSVHNGENTVIYDCATEEDFKELTQQQID